MKPMRYFAILLVAAGLMTAAPAQPAAASTSDDAGKYIQTMGDQAISVISNKAYDKEQKRAKLETVFIQSVDFAWVSRFVLGRFWKQATDEQKSRYQVEYQKFLLLNYTSRFANYSSGSFKVLSSRDDGDNEFTVSTQMQSPEVSDGEPVMVEYRLRNADKGFKIFDVIVEGVSLLTTQRSEFASVINNKGLDYLINQLAEKAAAGKIQNVSVKNG